MIIQSIDPNIGEVFGSLLSNYGPTGLAFGVLLWMIISRSKSAEKRISELESSQAKLYENNIDTHKQMINDYVDLVRSKTQVLSDLTGCLKAIKDTLERLERKRQD